MINLLSALGKSFCVALVLMIVIANC